MSTGFQADEEFNTGRELDTGIDRTTLAFSPEERAELAAWYERTHSTGGVSANNFVRFMFDYDPVGFKLYRRNAASMMVEPRNGVTLPHVAATLMFLHLYVIWGKTTETLYEIVAARSHGATKGQIVATMRFAFLSGGSWNMNGATQLVYDYLNSWEDDGLPSPVKWPDGWAVDATPLQSGIDSTTDDVKPGEIDALAAWHARVGESEPSYVRLWGRLHGEALKTWRLRYEAALRDGLPAQMAPLFVLHLATWSGWPAVVRRAILQARELGVRRHHVVQTMSWAALLYGGEWKLDVALSDSADILSDWPDQ